ncbi:MAG: family 43 glycosylhydrolase [Armatimonadota bacterium]
MSAPFPLPGMYYGDTSRLGRPFAKDPAVVRFGERYLLYYSIPAYSSDNAGTAAPGPPTGWGIGIAQSQDLDHWTRLGEVPPDTSDHSPEGNGFCAPGAIVLNGEVHLFYQTYGNGPRDAICHAVSGDGVHFRRNPSNPIFRPAGDWNNGRAIDADVIPWKGDLLLFFSTRDPEGKVQMGGVASSPLSSGFGRETWRQLGDGPTIKPELAWEQDCIEAAAVCEEGGRLYQFYGGAYNNAPQQIGCAVSDDCINWKRVSDSPLLPNGRPGEWNQSESGHPFIFRDPLDGRTHLFYQGNADNGVTWYLSRREIRWENGLPILV